MDTRLPLKVLYTMAVVLAVLAMLFLILTMVLKIGDLLSPSSSPPPKVESRVVETTVIERTVTVEKPEGGHDCEDSSALYDAEGLTGRFVYVCNNDIYRMNLSTGEVERLTRGANYPGFVWSPDGEKIAWSDYQWGDLYVAEVGDASPYYLGNGPYAINYDWSPDGESLAFVSQAKPGKSTGLATITADGTSFPTTILSNDEDLDGGWVGDMDWSPDGKKFVLNIQGPPGAKTGLYTVNADGTDLTKISRPKTDPETNVRENDMYWDDPTYSPDGKSIAFIKDWEDGQIYTMKSDGTDVRQVTHHAGENYITSWSPDSKRILYENESSEHRDLFLINADGTGKQRLTTGQSSEDMSGIHNVLWLPEGGKA